jgi:septal ring factor EnvC (AmiA/AmiB activator)
MSSLKSQLTEKSNQMKVIAEQRSSLEKQLKDKESQLFKTNQELVVSVHFIFKA